MVGMREAGRIWIFDCWSAAEIPIHRGLLTIVFLAERVEAAESKRHLASKAKGIR